MSGRRVVEKAFLDPVPVEPGDRGQPPRHRRPGAAPGLQVTAKHSMSARRAANNATPRWWHHTENWRKSSMYASRVSPVYEARNPANASRSGSAKTGVALTMAAAGVVVVIGTSLDQAETPARWAYRDPSRYDDNPIVNRSGQARSVTTARALRNLSRRIATPPCRFWAGGLDAAGLRSVSADRPFLCRRMAAACWRLREAPDCARRLTERGGSAGMPARRDRSSRHPGGTACSGSAGHLAHAGVEAVEHEKSGAVGRDPGWVEQQGVTCWSAVA